MMAWIFDLIAVAVLAIAVFLGYRNGFLRALLQLVGWVAAFIVALALGKPAAEVTFDTFIAEGVQTQLAETLSDVTELPDGGEIGDWFEGLPAPIVSVLQNNTQLQEKLVSLNTGVEATTDNLVDAVMSTVIRPVGVALLQFVFFIVLFLVLLFVVRLLSRLIKPVVKLPLIRQVDGTLGAVLGLFKGLILLFALITVAEIIVATGGDTAPISQTTLDDTLLVRWIAGINPIRSFLM